MEIKTNTLFSKTIAYSALVVAWFLSGFLMYRSNHLQADTNTVPDLCLMIFGNSCDKALSSKMAWVFNYPLAGVGLAYFGLIGLLLSLDKPFIDRLLVGIAAFGVGLSVFHTKIIFDAKMSCPFCLSIHILNLLLFIALIKNAQTLVGSRVTSENTPKSRFILRGAFLVVTIVLGGISSYYALKFTVNKKPTVNLEEISKSFQSETQYSIPQNAASPIIGTATAPVQLVVFSSFQCPACKGFAPSLENIHQKYRDKVAITFRNFPLGQSCNPRISEDMQPQACGAAFAAKAAQLQNKFWSFHDEIFKSNLEVDDKSLSHIAKTIGLNMTQFEADKKAEAIKAHIAEDVNIGYQLSVDRTPTVFINGKRVIELQESVLNFLIEKELQK